MIKIIDCGTGNLKSISNMLEKIKVKNLIISSKSDLNPNDKIILPGVGSFDKAVKKLKSLGIFQELKENYLNKNYKILGICLGMQILCAGSEEGEESGLKFFNIKCKKFINKDNNQSTTIGWMKIKKRKDDLIIDDLEINSKFYFLHSYYVEKHNDFTIAETNNFQIDYSCIIKNKNIYGFQFHPERSHKFGLKILYNFSKI
jgi:glutamine amidotransferase